MYDEHDAFDPESLIPENSKVETLIRRGFVQKVYGIVLAQLITTFAVAAFFTLNDTAQFWIVHHGGPLIMMSGFALIALVLSVTCIPSLARRHPQNMIVLGIFTLLVSVTVSAACAATSSLHGSLVVVEALGITVAVFAALTAFAFQTKWDVTIYHHLLFVGLMILTLFGLLVMFLSSSPIIHTVYASLGALLFSSYIVVDTQLILGRFDQRFSPDDYVAASLAIYTDVINLFMMILQLLSQSDDN